MNNINTVCNYNEAINRKKEILKKDIELLLTSGRISKLIKNNISSIIDSFPEALGSSIITYTNFLSLNEKMLMKACNYYINEQSDDVKKNINASVNLYSAILDHDDTMKFLSDSLFITRYTIDKQNLKTLLYNIDKAKIFRFTANLIIENETYYGLLEATRDLINQITNEKFYIIDLEKLNSSFYTKYINHYVLKYNTVMSNKIKNINLLVDLFNELYIEKNKFEYSNKKLDYLDFNDCELIIRFLHHRYGKNLTYPHVVNSVKNIFIFLTRDSFFKTRDGFFDFFTMTFQKINSAHAIPIEELKIIKNVIASNTDTLNGYTLYVMFHLILQTELRLKEILSLGLNSVREFISDTNIEYIETYRKENPENKIFIAITSKTKMMLREYIIYTEYIRGQSNREDKNSLFIFSDSANQIYRVIRDTFNDLFKKVCISAVGKPYTYSNIRDTRMKAATIYIKENKLNEYFENLLTGHQRSSTTRSYINSTFKDITLKIRESAIGDFPIEIEPNIIDMVAFNSIPDTRNVNNSGKCSIKECNQGLDSSCLLCKYYVTTVDYRNFFVNAIANINMLLTDEKDVNVIKKLEDQKVICNKFLSEIDRRLNNDSSRC